MSTDDAQVKQDIVSVSPQVNGQVVEVFVRNGAKVKRGDLLFRIDPQPYRVALEQAEAHSPMRGFRRRCCAPRPPARAAISPARRPILRSSATRLGRQQALLKQGFTTRADYDDALNEVRTAETQLADAQARAANAHAAVVPGGDQPQIAQAQAAVDKARLDLSRTDVRAPMDGVIENADNLQVGQMAITGVGMVRSSTAARAWVEANFKEKDVGRMVAGPAGDDRGRRLSAARSSTPMSRASAPEPAANSRCSRRRMPTATGSRSRSACRCGSRSTATLRIR